METPTPADVAHRVRADIERISTVKRVAEETGIAYTTLNRRLADGNFTATELIRIGAVLRSDPRDYLAPAAEHSRSAA